MSDLRTLLAEAYYEAIVNCDPKSCVFKALAKIARPEQVRAIAIGKAAEAMLAGARGAWSLGPDDGRVFGGAHPVPDESSVAAAEDALEFAASGGTAVRLFLVSGGASSMLCAPHRDGSLAQKQDVTHALLRSGVDIASVNVVRAHLSRIKGGGLARAAGGAPQLTVVVSDVLVGEANSVGSGPTLPDPSTIADARRIADAAGLGPLPFHETPKDLKPAPVILAASPGDLAVAAGRALEHRGFAVTILPPSISRVSEMVSDYVQRARFLAENTALVRVAEPALVVPAEAGSGGRSTHLAAMIARLLPDGVAFLAGASDGVDGTSATAGAVVTSSVPNWDDAIAKFATGPVHYAAGTAIPQYPTGNNLADLHILARGSRAGEAISARALA